MGLAVMILGLVLFIGTHVVTTRRDLRGKLIGIGGEAVYKIGYAVLAIGGLALIAYGFGAYRAHGWIDVWYPPRWTRHLTALLMLPMAILLAAAYSRGRIYAAVKHPMITAVKLWALGHLIANGDLGSIILFGSLLAWAVYDRISLKRRNDAGGPPIPVGGARNDVIAIVAGVVLYLVLAFVFHPYVIGVSVFGA
ncbi:NnrU family protein [Rhodopseudomonas sp. HC1]|uniref:NnrU family protein n=1 Tax=Rhodopseudomonas infernalis TaxID=2897386 RepID=UPI001EE7CDF2|nr:NnrU family protein [Rhodopseudomonas infernalis]MCG6204078.1 NnrU family protein [Rhodopseudomonas infernalis]